MSKSRRLLLGLLLFLGTWLMIEAFSFVVFSATGHSLFSYGKVAAEMRANSSSDASAAAMSAQTNLKWGDYVEVLHPYFGFVADPHANPPSWAVSDYGFIFGAGKSPITKRSKDRLVVAVFGGSFANGLYGRLKIWLEARAAVLKKQVEVVNFSSAGYKQPQHLLVLNYLMALGAEFDVVVNVDGFNDITLPAIENIPANVNPFFPRGWDRRTADTISQVDVRRVGAIEFLKSQRSDLSRMFLGSHLYFSPTLSLVWRYRDRALAKAIYAAEQEIASSRAATKSYTMRGPKYEYTDDAGLYRDLAAFWRNSSAQMNALCAAKGTRYYHFLQPNQYVPGSKPMSAEERSLAVAKGSQNEHSVVTGYPVLSREGAELKADGVNFEDLTGIFGDVSEPVYVDDCCHLNGTGYDIVADRIGTKILKE